MEYEEALKDILTCDKEKLKELGIWDKIYDKGIDRTLHIQIHTVVYNKMLLSGTWKTGIGKKNKYKS
jgi:hypothetical protein